MLRPFHFPRPKVDEAQLLAFTRQLAVLIRSGVGLLKALQILERQEKNSTLRMVITTAIQGLTLGQPLHGILESFPQIFDVTYCQMVKAGESSGDLGATLEYISSFRTRILRTKHRTVSALFYPITVLIVALAAVLFLTTYVVPRFENLLQASNSSAPMPALTRTLIAFGTFLRAHAHFLPLTIMLAVFGLCIGGQTQSGRLLRGKIALRLPFFGQLFLMQNLVIFLRTFGLLLEHAVPTTEALALAANGLPNAAMKSYLLQLVDRVRAGESLIDLLAPSPFMLPFVHGLLVVGEESGRLADMLLHAGEATAEELDRHLERAAAVLQPVVVLILAGVVALIAAAMLLPMAQMLQLSDF
ncbi:MAG: type II secretion system F family protein [Puniceicoccales bacterium]|jgi:type II secretory pathway component PulF|nr:type II secretion system F family protein [Puniceicoccales bacterium]